MALDLGTLIPGLIWACKTMDPLFPGLQWASNVNAALCTYVNGGGNIRLWFLQPYAFTWWMPPFPGLLVAQKSYSFSPFEFGVKVGIAIETSIRTIYTAGQLRLDYIPGQLPAKLGPIFSKINPLPEIAAIEMAQAIHTSMRTVLITVLDNTWPTPKPITGPFI